MGNKGFFKHDESIDPNKKCSDLEKYKTEMTVSLLKAGFAVIAPAAAAIKKDGPADHWCANTDCGSKDMWPDTKDGRLMTELLDKMASGSLGHKFDMDDVHAAGFSSGGYFTSRLALQYGYNDGAPSPTAAPTDSPTFACK